MAPTADVNQRDRSPRPREARQCDGLMIKEEDTAGGPNAHHAPR
jgi:hypothetical protein